MSDIHGRDLDLNLLRVFVAVADTGSATQAAAQLYVTQSAVSAALRRLTDAIGAPLFAREGRGLALTQRGERLLAKSRPHLLALVDAVLSPGEFDPMSSERILRLGLSDAAEQWLLPALLRSLAESAPCMRLISVPIHFRSVQTALTTRRIDVAVTVADEMPNTVRRQALFSGSFVCLFDPRHARIGKTLSERRYFEHEHVIVSYNGDLRGIVEDLTLKTRRVRCSLASFQNVGAVVEGTALLATVPELVARHIRQVHPALRILPLPLPLALQGGTTELLWPGALDDDDAARFVRGKIVEIAARSAKAQQPPSSTSTRRKRQQTQQRAIVSPRSRR
jgi:LysR family transcriptional activator of mexEF-oprN operon